MWEVSLVQVSCMLVTRCTYVYVATHTSGWVFDGIGVMAAY